MGYIFKKKAHEDETTNNCTLSLLCAVSSNLPLMMLILISEPEGETQWVELLLKRRTCWGASDWATGSSSHLTLWKQSPAVVKGHW